MAEAEESIADQADESNAQLAKELTSFFAGLSAEELTRLISATEDIYLQQALMGDMFFQPKRVFVDSPLFFEFACECKGENENPEVETSTVKIEEVDVDNEETHSAEEVEGEFEEELELLEETDA